MSRMIFWIPRQTKSGWKFHNWRARYAERQVWAEELLAAKRENKFFNRVHIVAFRGRQLDKDNFMAGLKPLIDAMKHRGLIEDDRPSVCHITATLIWGVKPWGVIIGMERKSRSYEQHTDRTDSNAYPKYREP